MPFCDTLRHLRTDAGMTQPQLAGQLGISKSAVSMYERGEREPDIATLQRIAAVFGVDMNLLLDSGGGQNPLGAAWFALAREMQTGGIHPEDVREMLRVMKRVQGMTKLELYRRVDTFRAAQGITCKAAYPLKSEPLAVRMQLTVERVDFKTPGLRGAAMPAQRLIILDAKLDAPHANFYCAHELCHHLWHAGEAGAFRCFDLPTSAGKLPAHQIGHIEWQANEGAAELLVPMRIFLPTVKKYAGSFGGDRQFRAFRTYLAGEFGVPVATIAYRFESLKYELAQHLAGTPLTEIQVCSAAAQTRRGVKAQSLNQLYLTTLPRPRPG